MTVTEHRQGPSSMLRDAEGIPVVIHNDETLQTRRHNVSGHYGIQGAR